MPQSPLHISKIHTALEQGALIIASSHRLKEQLSNNWSERCRNQALNSWASPDIVVLHQWLEEQWQQLADQGQTDLLTGTLITPAQEQALWQKIIDEDEQFYPQQIAATAQRAYALYQQWQLREADLQLFNTPFKHWLARYKDLLVTHQLITQADLTLILIDAIQRGHIAQPDQLIYTGFETLSPLQQILFKTLSSKAFEWEWSECESPQNISIYAAHNFDQELNQALNWAKQQSAKGQRIGIVIPELAEHATQVERLAKQLFSNNFDLGIAKPLTGFGMINTALKLLNLNRQKVSHQDLKLILQSPYWGQADQTLLNSHIAFLVSELGLTKMSATQFRETVQLAEQQLDDEQGLASKAFAQMETLKKQAPTKQLLSQWAKLFNQQLSTLHWWHEEKTFTQQETTVLKSWQNLIDNAHFLNNILGEIDINQALAEFNQLARSASVKANNHQNPIEILSVLEASGIGFDKLWLMQMDDSRWPSPCKTNPLLPHGLQRQKQMPKSSPEAELKLAQRLINNFSCNAHEVVFSYAELEGETQLQATPLISHFESQLFLAENPESTSATNLAIETIDDTFGTPLVIGNQTIKGGTALFADQATCPFNAYVKHRLGAKPLKEPSIGLTPMERGIILHDCLEHIWQNITDSYQLHALSDSQSQQLINSAISKTLIFWKKKRADIFGPEFTNIETKRLNQLLGEWLEIEKTRPHFKVLACEQKIETDFAGIPLKLRLDRLDEVNGKLVITDYKTGSGSGSVAVWLGDRPSQPQLPLYAITAKQPVDALAFAVINITTLGFAGVNLSNSDEEILPNLSQPGQNGFEETPEQIISHWQQSLEALAQEYVSAYAEIRYENTTAANRDKPLWGLNRWPEAVNNSLMDDQSID